MKMLFIINMTLTGDFLKYANDVTVTMSDNNFVTDFTAAELDKKIEL